MVTGSEADSNEVVTCECQCTEVVTCECQCTEDNKIQIQLTLPTSGSRTSSTKPTHQSCLLRFSYIKCYIKDTVVL
jgi:hypothetical protein